MLKWLMSFFTPRKSILFVEDSERIQQELGEFLLRRYRVYSARKVEEAKHHIANKQFDYAILDLKLDTPSEFGGVEVWNYLRKNKPSARIIILSAYAFDQVCEEFKKHLVDEQNADEVLETVKGNYISKGGQVVYIEAVLAKLAEFDKKQSSVESYK